ncbi:MAG: DUF1513 domain-containing protein [Gammaproteobacteria bacterium]|nr:DUF1513 domain-containing protein [Gammaproteobacteria bacterium]NNJ48850.1 DUF1513 domain-containing protein [Gammaproteobacteria bacterium]
MSTNNINRRRFLSLLSSALAGGTLGLPLTACTHKELLNPDEDILLSGGNYSEFGTPHKALIIINPVQKEKRVVQCDFIPHEIIIHPQDKYTVYCFEKDGRNACTINLRSLSVMQKFQCTDNHQFSGHAVFSKDNKYIYTIESEAGSQQGMINIRDSATFESVRRLPTLGLKPHDCQLLEQDIMVVSNTGQSESKFHQPSLVYIDMKSEKLLSRLKLDDERLNASHFLITKSDSLVIASAPVKTAEKTNAEDNMADNKLGGVSIKLNGEPVVTMTEPAAVIQRMQGEALGISINDKNGIAAVTHPEANLLTFWSLADRRIIKAIGMENPRGITQTLDENNFVISYGKKPAMAYIASSDLSPLSDSILQPTFASGEHLLNWSRSLREVMPTRIYG